jgi:phage tail protein X
MSFIDIVAVSTRMLRSSQLIEPVFRENTHGLLFQWMGWHVYPRTVVSVNGVTCIPTDCYFSEWGDMYTHGLLFQWMGWHVYPRTVISVNVVTCIPTDCCFSEWGDMYTHGLLFRWMGWHVYPRTVVSVRYLKIQLSVLVLYKVDIIIISSNITCSRHDIPEISPFCTHYTVYTIYRYKCLVER